VATILTKNVQIALKVVVTVTTTFKSVGNMLPPSYIKLHPCLLDRTKQQVTKEKEKVNNNVNKYIYIVRNMKKKLII